MSVKRKRIKGSERRAQILEAAKEICSRKGFSGTKLDEIAKKVGVSRALIIQHFGTKENLYRELIKFSFEGHPLDEDETLKRKIEEKDDYGVFYSFFHHILEHMGEDGDKSPLRLVLFSMLEKPELYKKHYKERTVKSLERLVSYISSRAEERAFKVENPEAVAFSFLGSVLYLTLLHLILPEEFTREKVDGYVKEFIKVLLKGLREGSDV